jgi:hypothetical protein
MFNSLKYVKILQEAGISREQAEIQVQLMNEIMDNTFATKQDLKDVEVALRHDISLLKQEIALSEQRMTLQLGTIESIAVGLAVTLAKLVG